MKYFNYLLMGIILGFSCTSLFSAELVKIGSYDFQKTLEEMGDEPFLRKEFPDALKEPLFLSLMLENRRKTTASPKQGSWKTITNDYGNYYIQNALSSALQKRAQNSQKSREIKNTIVLGLSLARQYRGYSIVLKPQDAILYTGADLSSSIASVLADYLSKNTKNQNTANDDEVNEEEAMPTTQEGQQ